ncbi:MAG: ABC-2 family transporter protein [Ruminococcus sp.]|jgi:ABC-2 type transport system permease protein|nr:ABC-2 family transporter protein [Ruminococcus sp.]
MVSILVGPIFLLVQYFIWTAVYGGVETLGGLNLEQMIRYFGASSLIGYVTMDFADWNLQMLVRTGKFLTFTLRPIHHRFFALSQKFGHRVLGLLVEFIPCLIIFILLFRIDMMPENILITVMSIILAFFVNFYVNYTLGLLGFWLVDAGGISRFVGILTNIFSGTLVPLTLFPDWAQYILLFLPFTYMGYAPTIIWTTGHFTLGGITMNGYLAIAFQLIAVCFMYVISEIFYRLSIRRFSGVGA